MDEDAVLLAIGELKGQMQGIGREIGDIKDRFGDGKDGLCGRISDLEMNGARISRQNAADIVIIRDKVENLDGKIAVLDGKVTTINTVSDEKKTWIDSSYTRFWIIIGAILGALTFIWRLMGK